MSPNKKLIDKLVTAKDVDTADSKFIKECMVELCNVCETQKRLTKLTDLFANLSDGILLFDSNGNFIDANRLGNFIYQKFELFDYHGEKYKLLELPFIVNPEEFYDQRTGKVSSTVIAISLQEDEKILNISASPIYTESSDAAGICIVINDATELQKQAIQLEDMMASFSHDLKTPLVAAEVNLKHLIEGEFGAISENQKKILELMLKSNENALKLVKNLLDIFKYETRSYKLLRESVQIGTIFQKALAILDPIIKEKSVIVEFNDYDVTKTIQCDSFEIKRVIINILSNAVKYSSEAGKIKITILVNDKLLSVSIQDYGLGMTEGHMSALFHRFWQSKQHLSNTHGTGLGLYLSKKIIDAHDGKIWVESKVGEGTTISFQIPMSSEQEDNE